MKKIFHFVSTNYLSGLENVVLNISILLRNKYHFVYVSPNGKINYYLKKYHIKHICVNKITPLSVKHVINKYHPNIVQGHDVKASLALAVNVHLCHKYNIKIISELHNDDPRMHRYSVRSILYYISSFAYDDIIGVYGSVINNYIFNKTIYNKSHIIRNIVNPYRIKKYPSTPKKWDCIFLGRFVEQKDPIKFIKIIYFLKKRMPNISAIMLGNGSLLKECEALIHSYQLKDNIKLVGFQRDPYKYLCESKVLIMPSKYEGLSLVALESLICGIPIVASNIDGFRELINDKCGYLANNLKEFISDTHSVITDKSLYDYKSKESIKHGYILNNVHTFISGYENVYNERSN